MYTAGPTVWQSEDHYLDLLVTDGVGVALTDVDELLDAVRLGLLTPEIAEDAVQHAVAAVDGLAQHGYDLNRWLSANGMELTWRPRGS
jgi:predicted RNA-binding protein associated with RNAse of E/G family